MLFLESLVCEMCEESIEQCTCPDTEEDTSCFGHLMCEVCEENIAQCTCPDEVIDTPNHTDAAFGPHTNG